MHLINKFDVYLKMIMVIITLNLEQQYCKIIEKQMTPEKDCF